LLKPPGETGTVIDPKALVDVDGKSSSVWITAPESDVDFLKGTIPTAENTAAFWKILESKIPHVLYSINSNRTTPRNPGE
jgi:hypothetical protein